MTDSIIEEPPSERAPDDDELVPVDDTIIGVAFKWSLIVIVLIGAGVGAAWFVSRSSTPESVVIDRGPVKPPDRLSQNIADQPSVQFTDITRSGGVDFVHTNGATGEKLLPETMGSGCAFLDYDNDGDQDLLLVNGAPWPNDQRADSPPTMALYRNDGSGHFENVTAETGLDVTFYGTGVACGDYDNDGDIDLFIGALGANHLFRNDDGIFVEQTDFAGVAGGESMWSTSAGFFDYDNDGYLDLFVCNYVQWSRQIDLQLKFTLNGTDRAYGPPLQYQGTDSYLYHNNGDGTFTDVTNDSGIAVRNPATGEPMGKALAVTFADIDDDGHIDIVVANDTVQNFLFRNLGDGTFEEVGAASGVAFDTMGGATGAMGIDIGEIRNDGQLGIGIGNFANEPSSFYVQQPRDPWQFADMSSAEGIGSPSRLTLSFGLFFFDYDLDGWLDMLQANGHLESEINAIQSSQHYRQAPLLFWNCGADASSCFAVVPGARLGDLSQPIVGRGAAHADIDGDGDQDIVLTQTGGPPLLLRNDQQLSRHWLRVKLIGGRSNRDAIGARVELTTEGITQRRQVMPTCSYLSQVELPITFGLGETTQVDSLRITWPGGSVQTVAIDQVDTTLIVTQRSD